MEEKSSAETTRYPKKRPRHWKRQAGRNDYAEFEAMQTEDLFRAYRTAERRYYASGTRTNLNAVKVLRRLVDERLEQR